MLADQQARGTAPLISPGKPSPTSVIAFSNLLTVLPTTSLRLPASSADGAGVPLLPYKQLLLPPLSEETRVLPPDSYVYMSSCALKVVSGSLMGAFAGVGMGFFFGMMGDNTLQVAQGREVPTAPVRESLRSSIKALMAKSRNMALTFGVLTALFEGSECVVERYRGKHDVWNPMFSGCFAGAASAAKAGPGAACFGCLGFAGFSVLIDKVMGGSH